VDYVYGEEDGPMCTAWVYGPQYNDISSRLNLIERRQALLISFTLTEDGF
jgi:hypothetical protein